MLTSFICVTGSTQPSQDPLRQDHETHFAQDCARRDRDRRHLHPCRRVSRGNPPRGTQTGVVTKSFLSAYQFLW